MSNIKKDDEDPLAGDLSDIISKARYKKTLLVYAPKDRSVTLRMPENMIHQAKAVAKKKGIKYQRLMRDALADYLVKEGD